MIRRCDSGDFDKIYEIINDSAQAYKGIIPEDLWKEPYMSKEELHHEIESGIVFWGYEEDGEILGVMGIQDIQDVTLIRHAYVRTDKMRKGIGSKLLTHLKTKTSRPILIGTWADAFWAIRFYEKHGFRLISSKEKDSLLKRYWIISIRQAENSIVLADSKWFSINQ